MDINALSSGASGSALSGQTSPSASKKALDSRGLNKALNQGALVSGLLPPLSSQAGSSGSGGLASDIYIAVGMQTQGMMSRGLMGIRIANVSLGIDMSEAAKDAPVKDAHVKDAAAKDTADDSGESTPAVADKVPAEAKAKPPVDQAAHEQRVLDGMLKEEEPAASRYYSSPDLANPALGGLLNSLG